MIKRCRICGTPVSEVSICNYCRTEREERNFFKMVTREELREARIVNQMGKIKPDEKGNSI
jgi:recombinational DNA repair protein RecR